MGDGWPPYESLPCKGGGIWVCWFLVYMGYVVEVSACGKNPPAIPGEESEVAVAFAVLVLGDSILDGPLLT